MRFWPWSKHLNPRFCVLAGLFVVAQSLSASPLWAQASSAENNTLSPPQENQRTSVRERRRRALGFCRLYEGKLLAYYNDTFRVKNCRRLPVSYEELSHALKAGEAVEKVSAEVIYAIPVGAKKVSRLELPSCQELQKTYITPDHDTVYFVENCRKRLFDHWDTYTLHRHSQGVQKTRLIFLETEIVAAIKDGKPMPSQELSSADAAQGQFPQVLDRKEVCRRFEGKFISYFSLIYKVQKCLKRSVDAGDFSRLSKQAQASGVVGVQLPEVIEVSGDQWMSLPSGDAYELRAQDFGGLREVDLKLPGAGDKHAAED